MRHVIGGDQHTKTQAREQRNQFHAIQQQDSRPWVTLLPAMAVLLMITCTARGGWEAVASGVLTDTYENGDYTGFTMTSPGSFIDWIPDNPDYDPTVAPGDLENFSFILNGTRIDSDGAGTVFYEGTYEIIYADTIVVSAGTLDMTATWTGGTTLDLEGTLFQTDGPEHENFTDLSFGGQPASFTGTYEETGGGGTPEDPTIGDLNGSLVMSAHLVGEHFNSGSPGHPTISSALSEAESGQMIVVTPGTYNDAFDFGGKAVHLQSTDGSDVTIIDASGLESSVIGATSGEGSDTIIEGFTITGGEGTLVEDERRGGGMYNLGASPTVIDVIFTGNTADLGGGMYNGDGSAPVISDSAFLSNTADDGGAIFGELDSEAQISDSLFCDNEPDNIAGPWSDLGSNDLFGICPTTQPQDPPNPVVVSEDCDEVVIGWPDETEPPADVVWYWQADACDESTELGSESTLAVTQSGTYHLRAKNANSELWSDECGSVEVDVDPCVVNVPEDQESIQAAIALVAVGGEVVVGPGTYTQTIDFDGKAVHLRSSEGPEQTIIDASVQETGTSVITAANGEGPDTIIEGFTLTGGEGTLVGDDRLGGGLYVVGSSPTIIDVIITGNTADYGGGMYNDGADPSLTDVIFTDNAALFGGGMYNTVSNPSLTGCAFIENTADEQGGGIYNANGSMPHVAASIFEANTAQEGGGIFSDENSSVEVSDGFFCENEPDHLAGPWTDLDEASFFDICPTTQPASPPDPVIISDACDEVVIGWPNTAEPEAGAVWYWQGETCGELTELGSDSTFTVTESGTYHLRAKNANSELWSDECGSVEVDVDPCVVNVPEDEESIQAAIALVAVGGEVVVGPGTYTQTIDFDGKAVHLRSSEGPEQTIIDASVQETGTSVITAANGEGPDTIIEGFTLTGGEGTLVGDDRLGGGLYVVGSSPTIIDVIVSGNTADYGGGMYNDGADPSLTDVIFTDNAALFGGAMYNTASNPSLTGCAFIENTADEQGGGMHNTAGSAPMVEASDFESNTASEGGGMYNDGSDATLTDVIFAENSADSGGGVYNHASSPALTEVLFAGNTAVQQGGGMYNGEGSEPIVSMSDFEANTADEGGAIYGEVDSPAQVSDSLFCENEPTAIEGPWVDLGGNGFFDICPGTQPSSPPAPVIVSEACDEVVIGWPDGVEPESGAEWYWQQDACDESTALGSGSTLMVTESGTYHLRAKNVNSELWSEDCGSVEVTVIPCAVNVPEDTESIQAAIELVWEGGDVIVGPGTYTQPINFNGKPVHLRSSDGPEQTIIDGSNIEGQMSVITAISGEGPDTIIEGLTITGGTGTPWDLNPNVLIGGGMYINNSSPTIIDCIFQENTGANRGGAIYLANNSSPVIENCSFIDNAVDSTGGAMYVTASAPLLINCVFEGNTAFDGGGMYNLGSSPIIDGGVFQNNVADNRGGGIYGRTNSNAQITDTVFDGNIAVQGGGIYSLSSSPTIDACVFENNEASGEGGGLYGFNNSHVEITDTVIVNNTADEGGGIYSDGSEPVVMNSEFFNNSASRGGGIANVSNSHMEVNGCTFEGNDATRGGAMYNNSSNPTISASLFEDNDASRGGGMYSSQFSAPTIIDSVFVNNTADEGGAVHNLNTSLVEITDCAFEGNSADQGGALYNLNTGTFLTVTNGTFEGNSATRGGGIYNAGGSSPDIIESTFDGNAADEEGGGVYNVNGSSPTITNTEFWNNTATLGAGVYNFNNSHPLMIDCLFQGNSATSGGGAVMGEFFGASEIRECIFCDNSPNDIQGSWTDLGNNQFVVLCPGEQPPNPPQPVIKSEECDEVVIGWPIVAEPMAGVTWYWQGTECGESTDLGSGSEFTVTESGTYYLRARNTNSDDWSNGCTSIQVTVIPCTVNVPGDTQSIQSAIETVWPGGEVIVGPGTYTQTIDFDGKAVHLRSSDGPGQTIIDVSVQEAGTSVVTAISGEGPDTIIEGFTLTGGEGTLVGEDRLGGGMYLVGSDITVVNVVIEANTADYGGGIYNEESSPTITGVVFLNNTAEQQGGGMFNGDESTPSVSESLFEANTALEGGGIYGEEDSPADIGDTFFCENEPDHIAGPWVDLEGNEFSDSCDPCPADLTGPENEPDGVVDVFDLLKVIGEWGACADPEECPADLTGPDNEPDGVVDVFDLLKVIGEWGSCP